MIYSYYKILNFVRKKKLLDILYNDTYISYNISENSITINKNKDNIIGKYYFKHNAFSLHHVKIWLLFETTYSYKYDEIENITSNILSDYLNKKELNTNQIIVLMSFGMVNNLR